MSSLNAEQIRAAALENLALYASEYIQGPAMPPYSGKSLIAEHHEEWADLINSSDRVCIIAPRDHGKSAIRGSQVLLADGTRCGVEELAGQDVKLVGFDLEQNKFVARAARVEQASVPVPCLEIRFKTGRVKRVTREHPFLSFTGWKEAQHFEVGQRAALPRELRNIGHAAMTPGRAWLLGLCVGDGCHSHGGAAISKGDTSVQCAVRETVAAWGWTVDIQKDGGLIALSKGGMCDGDTPRNWLREHGLAGCGAYEKRVPRAIFQADDASIAEFISGYVDSDCHINLHGGGAIEFYSVAQDLMRDVQHLLMRLGVISVLSEKCGRYRGEQHLSWRLTVRGLDVLKLAAWAKPRSEVRTEALRLLVELQEEKSATSGKCVDRFPREVWNLVEHSEDWFRKRGLPRPNTAYEPTRAKLEQIAYADGSTRLRAALDAPIFWDEVVEITDIGNHPVYPVHVPGIENYVCDDVVDHNSFMISRAYSLWMAEKHPGNYGFIFSASDAQAGKMVLEIGEEVETNPKLAHLNPPRKKYWSGRKLQLANGFTLYGRGYGTKVRGAHPIFVVADDVLNDQDAYSAGVRERNIDYFMSAVSNMPVPGGQIIVVGTPYSVEDLYAKLEVNQRYLFRRFPAVGPDGRPLWAERYSAKRLRAKADEIGPIRFSREFLCNPLDSGASLFPRNLFEGPLVERPDLTLGMPIEDWRAVGVKTVYMGVDFAVSANVASDYTVIFVVGLDERGNWHIMDIVRERGMAFRDQLARIAGVAQRYEADVVACESNQSQSIFGNELIAEYGMPIMNLHTGTEKHSLEKGVPSLRVLLESRRVRIPRATDRCREITDIWIDEMQTMTVVSGKVKSVGQHDDCLRAGTMIRTRGGYRPIETIAVGDEVLTHRGRYRPVEKVLEKPFDGQFYTMRFGGNLPIDVSYNHPVYAAVERTHDGRRNYDERGWVIPGEWRAKDRGVFVPEHRLPGDAQPQYLRESDFYDNPATAHTKITEIPLDADFARFLGRFLADGCCQRSGIYRMSLAFNVADKTRFWFADYLRRLGAAARFEPPNGCGVTLVFSSKLLWSALQGAYSPAREKQEPAWMWKLGAHRVHVLEEWLAGDGWVNRKKDETIGVTTSMSLALSMRDLGLWLGRRATVRRVTRHRYGRPTKDQFWVSFRPAKVAAYGDNIGQVRHQESGEVVFPTRSVSAYHYSGSVYNLQVAEDESFVANGLVVHNCVMAMFITSKGIKESAFGFSFGEQEGDKEAFEEEWGGDPYATVDGWEKLSKRDGSVYRNRNKRQRAEERDLARRLSGLTGRADDLDDDWGDDFGDDLDLDAATAPLQGDTRRSPVVSKEGVPSVRDILSQFGVG